MSKGINQEKNRRYIMSLEKKGYKEILDKINKFMETKPTSNLEEVFNAHCLLDKIEKICKGVLGDEEN